MTLNVKNNPTRCDFVQFFIPRKLLYMFWVMLSPIIRSTSKL